MIVSDGAKVSEIIGITKLIIFKVKFWSENFFTVWMDVLPNVSIPEDSNGILGISLEFPQFSIVLFFLPLFAPAVK